MYVSQTCFELLVSCLEDLEGSSQRDVLMERLLHLPPSALTHASYTCLLAYFTAVNIQENKLTRVSTDTVVSVV